MPDARIDRRPETLLRRADFLRVAAARRRYATPGLVLQVAPQPAESGERRLRVGYTASRRVGGAVVRNRAKRRLREAVRAVLPTLAREGLDYVVIAREATATRPFDRLQEDLRVALRRLGAARPETNA